MPIQKFTSSVTMQVQPLAATVAGTAGASAYTLARLLGTGSTLSLITGTNSNLTLSGLNIVPTVDIGLTTQTAEVREVLGQVAVEYPVAITGNTAAAVIAPLTTMPMPDSGSILFDLDPNTLTGLADGARVTSYTDPTSGLSATIPGTGPVLQKAMRNGKAGFLHAAVADRIVIPRTLTAISSVTSAAASTWPDTATTGAQPAGNGWSAIIIINNPTASAGTAYAPVISDDFNNLFINATSGTVANMPVAGNWLPSVVANDIHTIVLSGEGNTGASGRVYVNGLLTTNAAMKSAMGTYDMIVGAGYNAANSGFSAAYLGGILRMVLFKGAFNPAKALQAHLWACNTYGKTSPLAGRTDFWIFDGDSITYGTGGVSPVYSSTCGQLAVLRGWKPGQYANVGKPSQQIRNNGTPGNDNLGAATRDVDSFRAVLGSAININVIMGEYYNVGAAGGNTAAGVTIAGYHRQYAADRKAAGKINKVFHWTSTDSIRSGAIRDGFNADLVANPGANIDGVWPIHTDAHIGVDGSMTVAQNPTVTGDQIHPNDNGYSYFKTYIDARMTAAGYTS